MGSMKSKWHSCSTEDTVDAFSIITESKYHRVILYNHNPEALVESVNKLYEMIRKMNSSISSMNDQWIPTNPYYFDDIDGCIPVRCAEISMDTVKNTLGIIAIFTGYNQSVLVDTSDTKAVDVPIGVPGATALASLALLGYLMH